MVRILKLQLLSPLPSSPFEIAFMSTASGICPTGRTDDDESAPFEME